MAGVFINYRSDAAAWAVLLDRELSDRFGADRVFRASRSIRPGDDFIDRILHSVRSCSVLLAVVGPTWLAVDKNGRRRLDDSADWVRREIAEALAAGVPIMPILTDGAPPLNHADLPADIAQLGRSQYLRLHHRNAAYDLQRILDEVTRFAPDLVRPRPLVRPLPLVLPLAQRPGLRHQDEPHTQAANTPELSPDAVWRLAERLALLRTMLDDGTRQLIVESLPLPVSLQIRRHRAVLLDVHAIVAVCLEYDGALTVLLRAVRRLEGPSRQMRELEVVLDDLGVGDTR